MTAIQKLEQNPIAHLSPEDIEAFGAEIEAIRQTVLAKRGASDAAYIRRMIAFQRWLEVGSRATLLASVFPPAFVVGTAGLTVAKILENMEIGHNVMHGQWDWMRDPKIHSTTWEWDNATPAEAWKHSHNELHHTYTNVLGKDNDLGYSIFRADEDQRWHPFFLFQPLWNAINACIFEYGIAAYDLELAKHLKTPKEKRPEEFTKGAAAALKKIRGQMTKDYVVHPLLAAPFGGLLPTLAANVIANVGRNIWSHSIIMCGHFPEGVATFEKASIDGETKAEWYLRQGLGSANITGGKAMDIMSGNLSHQVEHHLFPDLNSNRLAEVAPQVKAVFEKYGLPYVEGSFPKQLASAWHKVFRLSLPNGWLATTTPRNLPSQVGLLWKLSRASGKSRRAQLAVLEARAEGRVAVEVAA